MVHLDPASHNTPSGEQQPAAATCPAGKHLHNPSALNSTDSSACMQGPLVDSIKFGRTNNNFEENTFFPRPPTYSQLTGEQRMSDVHSSHAQSNHSMSVYIVLYCIYILMSISHRKKTSRPHEVLCPSA